MARIYPFRGVTFSREKFGADISAMITQPYDRITDEMREIYYQRHQNNIIRVNLGRKFPTDDEYHNYYVRSAGYVNCWLEEGILTIAEKPAIYAYHQVFTIDGKEIVRKGFVALGQLEPPGEGVKAHEKTLAGPKADRLNLMRHTRIQEGHIFMLYADPAKTADEALDKAIAGLKPDFFAKDWYGNEHRLWAVTDTDVIETVQRALAEKTLYIADGHHRYETAVNYWKECEAKGLKPDPDATETYLNRMMTFININDPGLIILPTHRVIYNIAEFEVRTFLDEVSKNFDIAEYNLGCASCRGENLDKALAEMKNAGQKGEHAFLFVPRDATKCFLLTLKDESIVEKAIPDNVSSEWKRLDVSILHKLILENILGIDAKALEEKRNIHYIAEKEEAFEYFEKDRSVQGVFFMNPTKIEQVARIAEMGERMPQKSTDFYPKLVTGMVMNKLRFAI